MNRIVQFIAVFATRLIASITGGVLVALGVILALFVEAIPAWFNFFIVATGLIVAAYHAWKEENDQVIRLRDRLRPRLKIASVPVVDGTRFRIRVNNLSGTAIQFAARLMEVVPAIDHVLPVHLQITHQNSHVGVVPAYESSLVEVFVDYPFLALTDERVFEGETIGFLLFGHPPAEVQVSRQYREILISVYPINNGDNDIGDSHSFRIIPRNQLPCIFGDAGAPYQEPI